MHQPPKPTAEPMPHLRPCRLRQRRALRLAILLAATLLTGSAPAHAQRSIVLERFDVEIQVHADRTIDVIETIRARFVGPWNGIYREIPVEYRTPQGLNYSLRLDVQDVTGADGRALRYESRRHRHYRQLQIWVPGATNATRTLVIRYRVRNALRFFVEHDELYWNVTGDEWEMPINLARARIRLPDGVEGVRATAFTGGYGSREEAARLEIDGPHVRVQTVRALNFKEGLTAVIGWNPGVVTRPTAADRVAGTLRSNLLLLIPLLVLPAMWWIWHARGRDPSLRPITVRYEPPANLTPAELGTLADGRPDLRDITATIVDLAVRGYLRIEELERRALLGLVSRPDYSFTLHKPRAEWASLEPHERKLLDALFRRAGSAFDSVTLSDLENRFYKDLPAIRNHLYDELTARGHYTGRPDRVIAFWVAAGVALGVVTIGGGLALSDRFGLSSLTAIVSGALSAAIVCLFARVMPARTEEGARMLEEIRGFEEYLSRVESDRFARTIDSPELFEKYLPFAMALGVERAWAKAFDGIAKQPPEWYRGAGVTGFRPVIFADSLNRMSTQAATAMASAPRSSGGSGFSGGGSSGGGFGGGGGRGF
jgi:hypothetical protein